MIRFSHSLYFPKLIRLGEVNFSSWSGNSGKIKTTALYKLDWSDFDRLSEEKHNKWADIHWKEANIKYVPFLALKYDVWLKSLRFAIPANYHREIKQMAQKGLEWRTGGSSFDTAIREYCLKPSASFIDVAFYLLQDCLYDEETNYFYRKPDRVIVHNAMLLKFWGYQTGRGLVRDFAKIPKLKSYYLDNECKTIQDEKWHQEHKVVENFIDMTYEQHRLIDKEYRKMNGCTEKSIKIEED